MGATNQFGDTEHRTVKQNIKAWNRAIPEAGYITLGTIRYGVKFSVDNPRDSAASGETISCHASTSESSGAMSCCKDLCCLGEPNKTKNGVRSGHNGPTMLPVYKNAAAKNRILSSSPTAAAASASSSSYATIAASTLQRPTAQPTSTPRTSSAVGDRLVIGSRESSPPPPTCCYYSVPTKIAQPFKSSSASSSSPKPTAPNSHHPSALSSSSGYRVLTDLPNGGGNRSSTSSSSTRKLVAPPQSHPLLPPPSRSFLSAPVVGGAAGGVGGAGAGGGVSSIVRPNYCHPSPSSSAKHQQHQSSTRASQASNASLLSSSQSNSDDRGVDSVCGGCSPTFNNSTDWIGNEASRARNLNAAGHDHHNQQQPQPTSTHHHHPFVHSLCANLNLVKCATHGCCPNSIDSTDLNASGHSDYSSLSECPVDRRSSNDRRYVNEASAPTPPPPPPTSSSSGQRSAVAAVSVDEDRLVQCGKSDPRSIIGKTHKLSVRLTKNCVGFGGNRSGEHCDDDDDDEEEDDANRKHDTKITQIPHYDKHEGVTGTDIKNTTRTTAANTNTTTNSTTTTTSAPTTSVATSAAASTSHSQLDVIHGVDATGEYDVDVDFHTDATDESRRCETANHKQANDHAYAVHPDYDDLSFIDSSAGDFSSASDLNQSAINISSTGIPKSSQLDSSPKINSVTLKSCFKNVNNNNISKNNNHHQHTYKHIGISQGNDDAKSINPERTLDTLSSSPYLPSCTHDQVSSPKLHQDSSSGAGGSSSRIVNQQSFSRNSLRDPTIRHHSQRTSLESPTMDKRRKTLDRWQRLGFGRRSVSNPPSDSVSHSSDSPKSEKTERLKELTEMLRGGRAPQSPPPVPPPRKPRSPMPASSAGGSIPSLTDSIAPQSTSAATVPLAEHRNMFHDSLKAISKSFRSSHQDVHSVDDDLSGASQPVALPNDDDGDQFMALPTMDHGRFQNPSSQSHKNIPHRSASFSQVDYSSGKYIRSALGALKASIMKHKEPTVVENANLTLPRKKENSNQSAEDLQTNTYMNNEDKYIFLTDNPNRNSLPLQMEASSCYDFAEAPQPQQQPNPLVIVNASEMTLDTLCEEEIHVQQPAEQDEYLQTATTCLIPVPVYECVGRDWNFPEESDSPWIAANEDETLIEVDANIEQPVEETTVVPLPSPVEAPSDSHIYDVPSELNCKGSDCCEDPAVVEDIPLPDDGPKSEDRNKLERANTWSPSDDADPVPEISVTPGSILELEQPIVEVQEEPVQHRLSTEYVEVRKRHSNEDKFDKLVDSSQTSLDSVNPNPNDERRKIDKSKRRKGMYIQWPVLDKQKSFDSCEWNPTHDSPLIDPASTIWPCESARPDIFVENPGETNDSDQSANSLPVKDAQLPSNLFLLCKSPEDNQSAFFDPNTPDSECSNRPVWPKVDRRQSLSCQSSEEKDEHPIVSASPSMRSFNKLNYLRSDSISDTESDRNQILRDRCSQSPAPSEDLKRYSKRPLRGPYGQMLEAEMNLSKPLYDEILEELNKNDSPNKSKDTPDDYLRQQKLTRKNSGYLPVPSHVRASSTPVHMDTSRKEVLANHRRFPSYIDSTTDLKKEFKKMSLDSSISAAASKDSLRSPKKSTSFETNINAKRGSKDESRMAHHHNPAAGNRDERNTLKATPELLAQLQKGSSEKLVTEQHQLNKQKSGVSMTLPTAVLKCLDTRTHVVVELFNTEQSYVESLETVVLKYLNPLKSPEYSGIVDAHTVDEIFLMVPSILRVHERFLTDLKHRLDSWDNMQQVGDAFIEVFSKTTVLETYATFVNNWNRAKDAIRLTSRERPAFSKFLEAMSREHKGKLSLDNLLIKPVQKFPNYELILSRLIKHTQVDHPDQKPLQEALKLVHDILLHLNCKEREALANGQREAVLREIEGVIEGVSDLVTPERQFLLFDIVSVDTHTAVKERRERGERGLFLFNDLLIITYTKRRSGTVRKPPVNTSNCPGSLAATLDANRYKLHMRLSIEDLEIVKVKDESLRKIIKEIALLSDDCGVLQQLIELSATLRCPHQALDDNIKELQRDLQRQLADRQANDTMLCLMDLTISLPTEAQNISITFPKSDRKSQWELALIESKKKLASKCYPVPEFVNYVPIRKTRAGLQFTCAAPTLGQQKDVWLCNSDGYVGQVCVLSMDPEPNVTSCNSVCNARILCVASVPTSQNASYEGISVAIDDVMNALTPLAKHQKPDLSSDSDDSESESGHQPLSSTSSPKMSRDTHSMSDEMDIQQSTMWMGMEDGFINVYNCTDNIRIKNTKIKIPHASPVFAILYFNNSVFVSLANGQLYVYQREQGIWDTQSPKILQLSSASHPVTRLLSVHGKLWCSVHGSIKILETTFLTIEHEFKVSDTLISNMVFSGNCVWMSMKNSAVVECYHAENFALMHKVTITQQVTKMLSGCDDIIKQHKAACMRVTSLMACKDTVWVGTSAGVLLTIHKSASTLDAPVISGIPYGHTGHVRVLTCVQCDGTTELTGKKSNSKWSASTSKQSPKTEGASFLVISGGDGYEEFLTTDQNPVSEVAGREDSTNHLLIWKV